MSIVKTGPSVKVQPSVKAAEKKRLAIEIPKDLYGKILMSAHEKNCTVTKWVIRSIIHELNREPVFKIN